MVDSTRLVVVWDKPGYASLQSAIKYIKEDSVANAERVRQEMMKAINELPDHPERHPRDKFKKNNPGNYRALRNIPFELRTRSPNERLLFFASVT